MEEDKDGFIESIDSEQEDHDVPLRPYEILTYPADFTLEVLADKWKKKEITVPELQRRFVWSQAQSSKLIESFLLGLPVPPVFFYQDRKDSHLLVVDGQQRLRSIVYFFSGLFGEPETEKKVTTFNLTGLGDKNPYQGVTFQKLRENDPSAFNKLQNSVLRSFVMKQLDPQDDTSIFQVFERLNTGGVSLQGQEIRNCIYYGTFNEMLAKLNRHGPWRQILGRKTQDKRMRDIELMLRFFALFYNVKHYEKPMKNFLNEFTRSHRNLSGARREQFIELFQQTSNAVIRYLGQRPFHIRRGLNAAVYDSVFTAFARNLHKLNSETATEDKVAQMKSRFDALIKDPDYLLWTSSATTDKDIVPKRIDRAEEVLFG